MKIEKSILGIDVQPMTTLPTSAAVNKDDQPNLKISSSVLLETKEISYEDSFDSISENLNSVQSHDNLLTTPKMNNKQIDSKSDDSMFAKEINTLAEGVVVDGKLSVVGSEVTAKDNVDHPSTVIDKIGPIGELTMSIELPKDLEVQIKDFAVQQYSSGKIVENTIPDNELLNLKSEEPLVSSSTIDISLSLTSKAQNGSTTENLPNSPIRSAPIESHVGTVEQVGTTIDPKDNEKHICTSQPDLISKVSTDIPTDIDGKSTTLQAQPEVQTQDILFKQPIEEDLVGVDDKKPQTWIPMEEPDVKNSEKVSIPNEVVPTFVDHVNIGLNESVELPVIPPVGESRDSKPVFNSLSTSAPITAMTSNEVETEAPDTNLNVDLVDLITNALMEEAFSDTVTAALIENENKVHRITNKRKQFQKEKLRMLLKMFYNSWGLDIRIKYL